MSGFFGNILGSLMSGPAAGALPGILTQILGSAQGAAGGGLPALLQQLEAAGLGAHAASWVGNGEKMPVAPEELANVWPPEQIQAWAQQAGTTPEQLMHVLAQALPHAVDHATPNGEVPQEPAAAPDFGSLIARMLQK